MIPLFLALLLLDDRKKMEDDIAFTKKSGSKKETRMPVMSSSEISIDNLRLIL